MLERALALATGAGEVLLGHFGKLHRGDADRKSTSRDLVSKADLEAERFLVAGIPAGDDILAEEGSDRETDGAPRKWVIDPLDGTVNFLHGFPIWCVSIAVVEAGELVAGVVHAPAIGHTWAAAKGAGATLNGKSIRVTRTDRLKESIVATGFSYRRDEIPDHNFDNFARIGMACGGIRRMGAAAVDLAFLASGSFDGFWEPHLNAWDLAAGALLIREAGGHVTDFAGSEALDDILFGRNLVASNGVIHEQIRERLAPLRGLG